MRRQRSEWVESFVIGPHESARTRHPFTPFCFSCYLNNLSDAWSIYEAVSYCELFCNTTSLSPSAPRILIFNRSNRNTNITKLSALEYVFSFHWDVDFYWSIFMKYKTVWYRSHAKSILWRCQMALYKLGMDRKEIFKLCTCTKWLI